MTRSHLEVPFAFAHEPIYSEVIKSEAWNKMVPFSWGKAGRSSRGAALSNLVVFLLSQEQIKCNNRRQM